MRALPRINKANYLPQLNKLLNDANHHRHKLFRTIVNAPFHYRDQAGLLGLGIITLRLVSKKSTTIDMIALSDTEMANNASNVSVKAFKDIKIPVGFKGNTIAEAIKTGKNIQTSDWHSLFTPDLDAEESRLNQAGAGIACSFVYPLKISRGGALIYSYYIPADQITSEHHSFMKAYSQLVSQSLQKLG